METSLFVEETTQQYHNYLIRKGYPEGGTIDTYKRYVRAYLRATEKHGLKVCPSTVEAYLLGIDPYTKRTPFVDRAAIRALYLFAEMMGFADEVNWKAAARRARRYAPEREPLLLKDVLEVVENMEYDPSVKLKGLTIPVRWEACRAIATLQLLTGCRAGDAIRTGVNPFGGFADASKVGVLRVVLPSKGYKAISHRIDRRKLPGPLKPHFDFLWEYLQTWPRMPFYGPFIETSIVAVTLHTVYRRYYEAVRFTAQRVLGRPIGTHDFRRAFITTLLEKGIPLPAVQRFVGHASASTTARYYIGAADAQVYSALAALFPSE